MLKIATAEQMQKIDRDTIRKYGIPGTVLMERAGLSVVDRINRHYPGKKVIVLCGGGNNGGDGLVAARVLLEQGSDVKVFLAAVPDKLSGDAKVNYNAAVKTGVEVRPVKDFLKIRASRLNLQTTGGQARHGIIVDALFGTGLTRDIKGAVSDVIKKVNRLRCDVLSIDMPSGISSDTGQVMGCAVRSRHTVTFGLAKRGHLLYPGAAHAGTLHIVDIGFPRSLLISDSIKVSLVEKEDACSLIPERPRYSHKGTYGHVLLVAGSKGKTGAAFMAAKACLRTGAGLVTMGVPESLARIFQSRATEEMVLPLPDKRDGTLSAEAEGPILKFIKNTANVLAVGPGLSVDMEISDLVKAIVRRSGAPVVIDADGINALAGNVSIFKKAVSPVILTPHPGEMARLIHDRAYRQAQVEGSTIHEIERDRIKTAVSFARRTGAYVVLKGVPTITADPDGRAFINSTGNPGMATAGTGDVLTGMISALVAQGLGPADASMLAVYMHGLTGDIIAEQKGAHSLIASDIIRAIPRVFRSVRS